MGDDAEQMKHWMHTYNFHTGGVPADQVKNIIGIVNVAEYLNSLRTEY